MNRITNPIHKYLAVDEFSILCLAMRTYHGRNLDKLLEAYEYHGTIRPFYRLHIPTEYKQLIFRNWHERRNEEQNILLPEEYKDIHEFLTVRLQNYHATYLTWIDRTISDGHPLDWTYMVKKPYVEKPSLETFKPWKEFEIVEGILHDKYPQIGKIAEHYYAQWQVFLVEEAETIFSRKIYPFFPSESHDLDLTKSTLSLSEWTDAFEILAEYRFRNQLILEKYMNQTTNKVLEGPLLYVYHAEVEKQAEIAFGKITEERWIEFLRKLCATYFLYEESEKITLSIFLKNHIYSVVELYLEANQCPYSELVSKVGNGINVDEYFQWLPLEKILPDEEKEKKRAGVHLISLKDEFNALCPASAIHDNDIDEIINESIANGNGALLTSIININRELRKDNLYWHENIWNCYMGSLATAIETFGRKKFPDANKLSDCICKVAGSSQALKQKFDDYLKNNTIPDGFKEKITDVSGPTEFLFKFDIISNPSKYAISIPGNLIDLNFFLIANLTRNFVNHTTVIEMELFGSRFKDIYKSLIFTVFYFKTYRVKP